MMAPAFVISGALQVVLLTFIVSFVIISYIYYWKHKLAVLGLTLFYIGLYPGLEFLTAVGALLIWYATRNDD